MHGAAAILLRAIGTVTFTILIKHLD